MRGWLGDTGGKSSSETGRWRQIWSTTAMLGRRRSKLGEGRGWIWPVQAALRPAEVGKRQCVVATESAQSDRFFFFFFNSAFKCFKFFFFNSISCLDRVISYSNMLNKGNFVI